MAHKGNVSVDSSKLLDLAKGLGLIIKETSSYFIIDKPGTYGKSILIEKFVKKGSDSSATRWGEFRGAQKVPFVPSQRLIDEGIAVPHNHSSPNIKWRVEFGSSSEEAIRRFTLVFKFVAGVVEQQVEEATPAVAAA
jgi:hypothetical protein